MAMNPERLPSRKPAAPPAPVAESAPLVAATAISGGGVGGRAAPAPEPSAVLPPPPAHPSPIPIPPTGEPFTGLDPLTRSLVESAPLVGTSTPTPQPLPPTQLVRPEPVQRRLLKQPALLVALGGTLAAGLLVLSGATKHRRMGSSRAPAAAQVPAPAPIASHAQTSWLIAGGVQ